MTMTDNNKGHEEHEREKQQQHHQREHSKYIGLRMLCLHDSRSNAQEAHKTIFELDERLFDKHSMEIVYINSPLMVLGEPIESEEDRKFVWWENGGNESPYLGLDASLQHIQQIWKSMPFCGIIAIGQGASIASLLPAILNSVEFAVFIHGKALLEENEPMVANWPCLHVIRESDMDNECCKRLVKQYEGKVHCSGESLRKTDFNAIGKFLVQQKNDLRVNGVGEELVLQTQLHFAEHEAARVMAEHIADDPPKALMAVISPQSVGGWTGRKRREFGAEGGGAPCPTEFLLKREKRETSKDGPSRQHPNAARSEQDDLDKNDKEEETM